MSLVVRDLISGYGKIEILHGVSIRADAGSIVGIIGPNGSGKSTLLKSIYGILRPWEGKIEYNGEDLTGLKPHEMLRKGLSFLLQRRSVFPYLSVQDNLMMGTWIYRSEPAKQEKLIEEVYNMFPSLKERRNDQARRLSGGMQRMLELGRALITDPRGFLIDEFSAGLAPKIAASLYHEIARLKERQMIIILVEQNVRQLMEIADYVYVLKEGRMVAEGFAKDLQTRLGEVVKDWLRY